MVSIKNKTVVITGASRGLGKSLAQVLASRGAKLVISGRSVKDLEEVAKDTGAIPFVADITKENDVVNLSQVAIDKFGRIDIWINNAGLWLPKLPAEKTDMKRAHDIMEVNLFGTVYGSREAIKDMKKHGNGMIVNIASTSSLQGRVNQSMYAASKHAVKGFTDSIREELVGNGIMVIGVYPGGIKTDLFNEDKPADFDQFMAPEFVAEKIVTNIEQEKPDLEQVLKRTGQEWKVK